MTGRTWSMVCLLVGSLLPACSSGEAIDPGVERLGRATGPVDPTAAVAPAPQREDAPPSLPEEKAVHAGTVLERIQVPNYTYLRIGLADGREEWAAIPKAEIEVGAKVRVVESLLMRAFRSPTLDRTFETIVFGTLEGAPARAADAGPADDAKPPLPPGHPPI